MKQLHNTNSGCSLLKWLPQITLLMAAGFFSVGVFASDINVEQLKQFKSSLVKMEARHSGREIQTKNLQKMIQARSQSITLGTTMIKRVNQSRQKVIRNMR